MTDIAALSIEERLALLEARLAPNPTVLVPPIVIGSLSNVPAPGSQLAAQWAQDVTKLGVHRFATVAARDAAYPPAVAGNGAECITLDTQTVWVSNGTAWQRLMNVGGLYYQMYMEQVVKTTNTTILGSSTAVYDLLQINLPASPAGTLVDLSANVWFQQSAVGTGGQSAYFVDVGTTNAAPIAGSPSLLFEDRAQNLTGSLRHVGYQPPANTATTVRLRFHKSGDGGSGLGAVIGTNTVFSAIRYTP